MGTTSLELRLPMTPRVSYKLSVLLIVVSVFTSACGRSDLRETPDSETSKRDPDDVEQDGSESDGHKQPVDAQVKPNAGECLDDQDCPSDDPCQPSYCTFSGKCLSVLLPDGAACGSAETGPGICLDSWCRPSRCGDGFVDMNAGETCEDGNTDTTDSCVNCRKAICGDGYIHSGIESCDPVVDRFCTADCTPIVCGDGVIDTPIENCEPSLTTEPCNDVCRISDVPRWASKVGVIGGSSSYPILLVTSTDLPIVVYTEVELGSFVTTTRANQFDPSGDLNWQWESNTEDKLVAYNATIDANDQTVIVGATLMQPNPFISKLDPDGELLWTTIINELNLLFVAAAVNQQSEIVAVLAPNPTAFPVLTLVVEPTLEFLDADGHYDPTRHVSISGQFTGDGSLTSGVVGDVNRLLSAGAIFGESQVETLLMLLNSNGAEVWDTPVSYGRESMNIGFLQAQTTPDGDIIALGTDAPAKPTDAMLWLERFSPEGSSRWSETKPVRAGIAPIVTGFVNTTIGLPMSVDAEGNIYLGLVEIDEAAGMNVVLIDKYGPNGVPVWERPIRFDSGFIEIPSGLQVDSSGSIYLVTTRVLLPAPYSSAVPTSDIWLYRWEQPDGS
jgi:hypothetical protein